LLFLVVPFVFDPSISGVFEPRRVNVEGISNEVNRFLEEETWAKDHVHHSDSIVFSKPLVMKVMPLWKNDGTGKVVTTVSDKSVRACGKIPCHIKYKVIAK